MRIWILALALAMGPAALSQEPSVGDDEPVAAEPVVEPALVDPGPPALQPAAPQPHPPLLPSVPVPVRGLPAALGLVGLSLVLALVHQLLGRSLSRLQPRTRLGWVLSGLGIALRVMAFLLILVAVAAVLPESLGPVVAVAVLAMAVAIGWSSRELLTDLLAGVVLVIERRIAVGQFLSTGTSSGTVESVGIRATWLRDSAGRLISIPNRALLSRTVVADSRSWPAVEARVWVRDQVPATRVREVLQEAALLAPWIAPEGEVVVRPDPEVAGRWRVRLRLLDRCYLERLEAALQERLDETLLEVAED